MKLPSLCLRDRRLNFQREVMTTSVNTPRDNNIIMMRLHRSPDQALLLFTVVPGQLSEATPAIVIHIP